MGTLFFAFLFMVVLIFGGLVIAMRPTSDQKAITTRITTLKSAPGQLTGDAGGLLLTQQDAGGFAWIEGLAEHFRFSDKLQVLIVQADSTWTLGKLLAISGAVGCGAAAAVYFIVGMALVALGAGIALSFAPTFYLNFMRGRRVDKFNQALPDAIDMMARSMRAGHSVVAAIGIVAEQSIEPVKFEFNEVFKKQNYGLPLRECLMELLDRVPSQDLRVLVTGMLVQKETGGNLAEILDRITFVIRERLRIFGEIRTHTAQGRMTGWILTLLPVVLLFVINMLNPGYSSVLFKTPTGQKLLGAGCFLLALGAFIIRQIINGIEV